MSRMCDRTLCLEQSELVAEREIRLDQTILFLSVIHFLKARIYDMPRLQIEADSPQATWKSLFTKHEFGNLVSGFISTQKRKAISWSFKAALSQQVPPNSFEFNFPNSKTTWPITHFGWRLQRMKPKSLEKHQAGESWSKRLLRWLRLWHVLYY